MGFLVHCANKTLMGILQKVILKSHIYMAKNNLSVMYLNNALQIILV